MNRISIKDLKGRLSAAVAEAEAGRTVVITRHSRPVAQLTPAHQPNVHVGHRAGVGRLVPALREGSKGRYLAVLLEDRGSR